MTIPSDQKLRILNLLAMTSTQNDNEALSFLRKAQSMLTEAGSSLMEFFQEGTHPALLDAEASLKNYRCQRDAQRSAEAAAMKAEEEAFESTCEELGVTKDIRATPSLQPAEHVFITDDPWIAADDPDVIRCQQLHAQWVEEREAAKVARELEEREWQKNNPEEYQAKLKEQLRQEREDRAAEARAREEERLEEERVERERIPKARKKGVDAARELKKDLSYIDLLDMARTLHKNQVCLEPEELEVVQRIYAKVRYGRHAKYSSVEMQFKPTFSEVRLLRKALKNKSEEKLIRSAHARFQAQTVVVESNHASSIET